MPEAAWERRDEFLDMNPARRTPVMVETAKSLVLIDSMAICEWFEETVERVAMINGPAPARAEIRRLVACWFGHHFYRDVGALDERTSEFGDLSSQPILVGAATLPQIFDEGLGRSAVEGKDRLVAAVVELDTLIEDLIDLDRREIRVAPSTRDLIVAASGTTRTRSYTIVTMGSDETRVGSQAHQKVTAAAR